MLHRLKKMIPPRWFDAYHYAIARTAAFWYGHPSRHLIVIGVTGTNGKTTTTSLLAKALEASGFKTGCTSTAVFKIGAKEWLNATKMTMPGRFFLQKMLRRMVDDGCRYAVIETSSQGIMQSRQRGIAYDVAVFTNLTPEHIEAHGGFENYKRAKASLFDQVAGRKEKRMDGKVIPKIAVLNADSPHAAFYAATRGLDQIAWYGLRDKRGLSAKNLEMTEYGSSFLVNDVSVNTKLPGKVNVENVLAVLATCQALGVDLAAAAEKLSAVERIPGRFDRVEAGQPWTAIVDYAPEPESLRRLYQTMELVPHRRIIHVLGSCGGGRDVARRPILGRIAGEKADIVIVTNEDPYDDNPEAIIEDVLRGAVSAGKIVGKTALRITDRRAAIFQAMERAHAGDIVLMTGKGCESWICMARGKKIPWNEVGVAEEAIRAALHKPRPTFQKQHAYAQT